MLIERISKKKNVRVAVIGIGYVGLPLAVKLAEADFSVTGVDIEERIIEALESGKSTIEGIDDERIFNVVNNQKLSLIKVNLNPLDNDEKTLESLMGNDIIIVCVPTPLHRKRGWDPETSLIGKAAKLICKICETEDKNDKLPDERLVVLESTTYPGTTRQFFLPLRNELEKRNKTLFLGYSPERTSPGPNSHNENSDESTFQIKRIIAGIDKTSTKVVEKFYRTVFREVYPVADLETAEMTKLVENTFRFMAIGFANEVGRMAKVFGLNAWDVIDAVKTKPFGLEICYPGLVGGHCLPIDPHYLNWAFRNHRNVATFVDTAEKSHQEARRDVIELVIRSLCQNEKGLPKSSVLFYGIAYKKNVGDVRESGVFELMKKLFSYGCKITFWDPVRDKLKVKQNVDLKFSEADFQKLPRSISKKLTKEDDIYLATPLEIVGDWESLKNDILSSKFDCVVLATDHDEFRETYYELITEKKSPPIIDVNNTIEKWLRETNLEIEKRNKINEILSCQNRYMLYGRD